MTGTAWLATGLLLYLYVRLASTMGYGLSYLLTGQVPVSGPTLDGFLGWHRDGLAHLAYVGASLLVAAEATVRGWHGRVGSRWGRVLAWPWAVFGALMVVEGVLATYRASANTY